MPAKASHLAKAMGVSVSLVYDMISRGEIEAKRIGQRRLVIPNRVARKLLDMDELAA
ncbi:helix-turn-helix domain-containing protein [Methylobacterium sp. WL18]|nr:helix-turn-helix domain-containing protein [Methylobacterium sp. WL18]